MSTGQIVKRDGSRQRFVDVEESIDEYLDRRDWRVNANANQGYSLGGLILNVAGKVTANYWLSHVYPPEVGAAHREADLHIHDLDMLSGYCAGWSLRTFLGEGLNGVPGRVEAAPPRHLSSAVGQIVNFLGTLQNEWAGAQAFSSFDTYMAPFIRKDRLPYETVKQCMQEFEALERQEELQRKYTGGTVLHLYMSERLSSTETCRKLVRRALERFAIPYITVTPTFSICPQHGYLPGEHEFCPRCDAELIARKLNERKAA